MPGIPGRRARYLLLLVDLTDRLGLPPRLRLGPSRPVCEAAKRAGHKTQSVSGPGTHPRHGGRGRTFDTPNFWPLADAGYYFSAEQE